VLDGETISGIAKQYHVTATAIADANGLDAKALLPVGQKLIIPASQPQATAGQLVRYTVRGGDTLASIGDEFGVSVQELRRWNGLRSSTTQVARGVRLRIYPGGMDAQPGASATASSKPASSPAKPAAVSTSASVASVAAKPAVETSVAAVSTGGSASVPTIHRVQAGETLWSIAKAYSTTVESLRGANSFLLNRGLQAGDSIKITPAN